MILFDDLHNKICTISGFKERCITSTLSSGDKELEFLYKKDNEFFDQIKEEAYIQTKTDEFVIKQIEPSNEWYKCTAQMNIEGLTNITFVGGFGVDNTISNTPNSILSDQLKNSVWKVGKCNVTKRRTIKIDNSCTLWNVLQQIISTFRCEVKIDSLNHVIDIYEKVGSNKGAYFIENLNLKKLQIQSNTYDLVTSLKAYGKDGLTIDTLYNYQYTKKKTFAVWKDERYTDAASLKEDAILKLDELSKPYRSYTAEVKDLAASDPETYGSILSYDLGDTVMLISKNSNMKESHRIVKIYNYPENPESNKCEIANTKLSFEEVQKQESESDAEVTKETAQAVAASVDNVYVKAQVQKIQENLANDFAKVYATKTEVDDEHDEISGETKKTIETALLEYTKTSDIDEIITEKFDLHKIEFDKMYAKKTDVDDQKTDYKNRILWLAEKLGVKADYIAQFGE